MSTRWSMSSSGRASDGRDPQIFSVGGYSTQQIALRRAIGMGFDVDEMIRVNVKSALYGMQAIVPYFVERGRRRHVAEDRRVGRRHRSIAGIRRTTGARKS